MTSIGSFYAEVFSAFGECPAVGGVYRITCTATLDSYVGYSRNCKSRWKAHQSALRRGTHFNSRLNEAAATHGLRSLECSVIEEGKLGRLGMREEFWIRTAKPAFNFSTEETKELTKKKNSLTVRAVFSADELAQIDRARKNESRSEFVRSLVRGVLNGREEPMFKKG